MPIEEKIDLLDKQRKELINLDNFDNINILWKNLNENYISCQKELNELNEKILEIFNNINDSDIDNLSFQQAFDEMNNLIKKIDNVSISDSLKDIERIHSLNKYCLKKLNEQQASIIKVEI